MAKGEINVNAEDAGDSGSGYSALRQELETMYASPAQHAYLLNRWLMSLTSANEGMRRERKRFRVINLVTLGATSVTPVLVTATAVTANDLRWLLTWAAIVLSLAAAVGGVLLQTLRSGTRWRLKRTERDALEKAGWDLLTHSGSNVSHRPTGPEAWSRFVARVENAIGSYNTNYSEEIAGVLGAGGAGSATATPTDLTD